MRDVYAEVQKTVRVVCVDVVLAEVVLAEVV